MREFEFHHLINLFLLISLPNGIRAEVRVRLVECDRIPHRVDGVVEIVDGFIQLLAVLVFLPFVVTEFPDKVHTPSRDKKRSRMEELDSVLNRILSLSCSVSIESVCVYLVDALGFCGITYNNIRSMDFVISEHFRDIAISEARRVAKLVDCESVTVCKDSDDCGWVVCISEVESDVKEFVFI